MVLYVYTPGLKLFFYFGIGQEKRKVFIGANNGIEASGRKVLAGAHSSGGVAVRWRSKMADTNTSDSSALAAYNKFFL